MPSAARRSCYEAETLARLRAGVRVADHHCDAALLTLTFISTGFDLLPALQDLPRYFLLLGLLFAPLFGITAYQSSLPVFMALGSTRREAAVGLHLVPLTTALSGVVLSALTALLIPCEFSSTLLRQIPVALVAAVGLSAAGQLIGCAVVAFGRVGRIIGIIVVMLCSGVAGAFLGMVVSSGRAPVLFGRLIDAGLLFPVIIFTVVFLIVELPIQHRILRRYEVKL